MSGRENYSIEMLKEISQIDAQLVIKKSGGATEELIKSCAEYVEFAEAFTQKYNDGGIIEKFKDLLDDVAVLRERAEKLIATTVIWDIDEFVKIFKAGNKETIPDAYENLRICVEALLKRINRSECDKNGKLLKPPREKSVFEDDEELMSQPECGKTVSGNVVPMKMVNIIAKLVEDLEFDEAMRMAKQLGAVYYDETVNIEIKKLIWIMRMGEFEKASDSAARLLEEAESHNKAVKERKETVKPRLLVVDDVVDMLLMIKGILSDDCHVCTVTNHISALRFLENCHADIILLDIGLGEMSGFQLLDSIRELDKYKNTPVMFLTGDVSKETIVKAIDAGVHDYLRKPFDAAMLISRVRRLLKEIGMGEWEAD